MMKPALYDPSISYEENYKKGPPVLLQKVKPPERNIKKQFKFLGFSVNLPFGIAAGPLINSKFIKAAFKFGFDVSNYKTVRAASFPSHPFPNVLFIEKADELHTDKTKKLVAKQFTSKSLGQFSITNSFGVPSSKPEAWKKDVKKAITYEGEGQLMILSFMGTVRENQTQQKFIEDFAYTAFLAHQTQSRVQEANLSCPNIGNEGLVCYNLEIVEKVCRAIREVIDQTPLILKVGHYRNDKDIKRLAEIAEKYANAISVINTLQVKVVNEKGKQALPGGKNRLSSGIGGASIKWAGLEMTTKLNAIRKKHGYKYSIVGVGGVMTPDDYFEYRQAGADLVQCATASIWDPYLAYDIWKKENEV